MGEGTQQEISMGGGWVKTVKSRQSTVSAVLSAKRRVVQEGTGPVSKMLETRSWGVGTKITFEHWPEGAKGATQATKMQRFLLCPVSFPPVFRAPLLPRIC